MERTMRKDLNEVLDRNIALSEKSTRHGTLVHFVNIAEIQPPEVKPLELWKFPQEYRQYTDACIEREKYIWQHRRDLPDDLIPNMKPYYGIAEHSAFVGGTVTYGGNTSYHEHPLRDWDDLKNLRCDEENENFKMLMDSMRYLKERSDAEGFFVALRGGEAPMDLANAIRGNDLFMDFYDEEEMVHKLCEFCLNAVCWTFDHQLEIAHHVRGGVISGMATWMPGHSIGHFSEDASSMCSADMYRTFGVPYTQRMMDKYDCGMVHVHTMGRHVLPDIAAMEKIRFVQFTRDPNQPEPIEVYRENEDLLKDKIVMLPMRPDEIMQNLDFLARNKNMLSVDVDTLEEARSVLKAVRSATSLN